MGSPKSQNVKGPATTPPSARSEAHDKISGILWANNLTMEDRRCILNLLVCNHTPYSLLQGKGLYTQEFKDSVRDWLFQPKV